MVAAREHVSWMLSRLERETRAHHANAEADLFRVFDDPSVAGYRRFLATIYHFEYAVEARLVYVDELPIRFIATRLRSGALGDDLVALGAAADTLQIFSRPIDVPQLAHAPEALGWIYALQRNTLQHSALYRALVPRARGALRRASRYLTAYSTSVHQRWHELGAQLDRLGPTRAQAIVDAANEAFTCQHRWFIEASTPSLAARVAARVAI